MEKIENRLKGMNDRSASFICSLAMFWPENEGHLEIFEGQIHGTLVWPVRGSYGFGYDPMFVADGYDITFAEMKPEEKQLMNHRSDAFRKLVNGCFKES